MLNATKLLSAEPLGGVGPGRVVRLESSAGHRISAFRRPLCCCSEGSNSSQASPSPAPDNAGFHSKQLLKRELEVAVAEEDYSLAARLRDEVAAAVDTLSPVQQYVLNQLDLLGPSHPVEERRAALRSIGEVGDRSSIPLLAPLLKDDHLTDVVEDAMWRIFDRSNNPEVNELMDLGRAYLATDLHAALDVFTRVIEKQPEFAEGWNKRATVSFLLQRFQDAILDCQETLRLEPYHFGALSGYGLCLYDLGQYEEACELFDRTLAVHPGLEQIRKLRNGISGAGRGGPDSVR